MSALIFRVSAPAKITGELYPAPPFLSRSIFRRRPAELFCKLCKPSIFTRNFLHAARLSSPRGIESPQKEPHALLPVSPVVCTVSFTPFTPLIQFLRPSLCSRQGEVRQSPDHGAKTPKEQPHRPEGYRVFGFDQTRRSAFKTPRTSCKIVYRNAGISFERSNHETKRLFQKNRRKMRKVLSFCRDRRPSRAVKGSFEPNFGNLRSAGKESECRRREEEDSRKKRNLLLPARSGKKEISVVPPDIRVRAQAVRSAKEASEKKRPPG